MLLLHDPVCVPSDLNELITSVASLSKLNFCPYLVQRFYGCQICSCWSAFASVHLTISYNNTASEFSDKCRN